MKTTPETLNTIRTDYIEAIISKEEVEILLDRKEINNLNDLALISITKEKSTSTSK